MLDITLFHPTISHRHFHLLGDGDHCTTLVITGNGVNGSRLVVEFSLHNCSDSLLAALHAAFGPPTGHDDSKLPLAVSPSSLPPAVSPPSLPVDEIPF